jgi:hypothetical protein
MTTMKLRKDLPNKMKHIKLFEDFDLDNFLENPEEEIHGDLDTVDVGSYVNTYRGPGQIIDSSGNFWVIEPIASSSVKNFKVPKDGVEKMVLDDVKKMKSSASSSVNTARELESLNSDIENFMEGSISDEDGEWKYRGNIETAIEFIEEIIVDLHSLNKRDSDMKFTDSFSKVVSNLAILFDNLLEASEDKVGMEERIKSLIGEIQSF